LIFPAPNQPISMNEKESYSRRKREQEWRDAAYYYFCQSFPGAGPQGRRLPPSDVYTVLPFQTARRRDPINYAKTVKHIVDGITMAGAWPDDTPDYVTQHVPTFQTIKKGSEALVMIRITPRDKEDYDGVTGSS